MRIALANDTYDPHVNGSAVFTRRLAQGLRERGHDVLVIAPSTTRRSRLRRVGGIPVYGVRSVPILFYEDFRVAIPWSIQADVAGALGRYAPDLVHLQGHFTVASAVSRVARRMGLPVVGTNHFMPENLTHYLRLPPALEASVRRRMWGQFHRVFAGLDAVTTPTHQAANLMRANGFRGEVHVISNGIDRRRFRPLRDGDRVERYGLPERSVLLYVGRVDKEKNLDWVLRAISLLPRVTPIQLVIAGKGVALPRLKELTAELGIQDRVTFLGFVPEEALPALYRAASCFIMAGTVELQSLVTMEAMASGLPVVAADALALPALVHHGENGFLFPPGDIQALADSLGRLFTDDALRRGMGDESLRIIAGHSFRATVKEFEATYARVLADRAVSPPACRERGWRRTIGRVVIHRPRATQA